MALKKFIMLLYMFPSILFTFFICACDKNPTLESNGNSSFQNNDAIYCMIDLRGEVMYPGIYKVESGTMLNDLLDLAGGVSEYADMSNINLVTTIVDNMKIIIPKINNLDSNSLLNINKCTKEELMMLPDIGSVKAEAIINYRKDNGNFFVIEDLMKVKGISSAIFEKIKIYITI